MAVKKTTKQTVKKSATKRVKKQEMEELDDMDSSYDTNSANEKEAVIPKKYVILVLVLVLLGVGIYLLKNYFTAAVVNGETIDRFRYIKEMESMMLPTANTTVGKQALTQLETKMLIEQEAKRQKVTVSQKELDDETKQDENILKERNMKLSDYLSSRGISRDAYNEQLKLRISLRKMLSKNITVTDKEVADYIETNKANFPEGTQIDDKLKQNVKLQIQQQKLDEKTQSFIEDLRKKAKIEELIKF